MRPLRVGFLHPAKDPFPSSAILDRRVVEQFRDPHEIVDLPLARGEWAGLADLDFRALIEPGIDALYYSPRNYHALPFIARELGGVHVPIITMAFSGAIWMDAWLLMAPLVRPGDMILAPSRSTIGEIRRVARLDGALVLSRFGLDVGAVRAAAGGAAPPEGATPLLFLSRVVPDKGPGVAIEALPLLDDLPGVTLDIVGPGDERYLEELRRLARARGVARRVTIGGPRFGDEKYARLAGAAAVVLPTTYPGEAYPAALVEALAVGTPVVASAWAGIPEMVAPGVNGALAPVAWPRGEPEVSPRYFASALRRALGDPARRAAIRAGAEASGAAHDIRLTRREALHRLASDGPRPLAEDRWAAVRGRTVGSMAGLVNPALLEVERRALAAGGGTFGLPASLAETSFEELLAMLDRPEELRNWRLRWRLLFMPALIGEDPIPFA
jgi:glycosyltransferase involved in cell wall biosynthesis